MRLNSPTGYLLSFFSSTFGLLIAYESMKDLIYIPIFFIGSILTRSAGCIINDLFDRDLDKLVARTKTRPLASGALSPKEAFLILIILLTCCLIILLSLTITAIYVGITAFLMISLYPLMKRITHFPQVFLGFTFNLGCLIGYATITNDISLKAIILYISCCFWTVAYDTIYAFMDIEDDKKIGIKSTGIFFEYMNYKVIILVLYFFFILLFTYSTYMLESHVLFLAIGCSAIMLTWSVKTLDIKSVGNCLTRFKINNYVGFILFLGLLLEKV